MKLNQLSTLLLAVVLATGCGKDDDTAATPTTKATLFTSKNWRLTAVSYQESGTGTTVDAFADLTPCERDNYLRFNADHSLTGDEGLLVCHPGDPQTYTGHWELVSNETHLLFSTPLIGNGIAIQPEILELTADRMVLRGTLVENGDLTSVTTFTATLVPN